MNETLAIGNLVLRVCLSIAFPIFAGRALKLPMLNFISVPALAATPVLILTLLGGPIVRLDDGVFDHSYQEWLLIDNLYCLIQLGVSATLFRLTYGLAGASQSLGQTTGAQYRLNMGCIFFGLFLVSFVLTASLGFGLLNWMADPRAGYQFHREGVGPFYAIMTTSLAVSVFFLLTYARKKYTFLLIGIFSLPFIYLIGSKGFLIRIFFSSISLYLFRFRKSPWIIISVGAVVMSGLVLLNFQSVDIFDILLYFDYYPNSTFIYNGISEHKIQLFNGDISGFNIWAILPRSLFPDKPYVYGQVILSNIIYPGIADAGHTVGFGGPINEYSDFGLTGVILGAILSPASVISSTITGYVAAGYRRKGPEALRHPRFSFAMMYLLVPDALAYFSFPTNLIWLALIAAALFFSRSFRFHVRLSNWLVDDRRRWRSDAGTLSTS